MKRLFLTFFVTILSLGAFAQEKETEVNQKFFDAKIREFVYWLELTDAQKASFIPIYQKYNDEMRQNVGKREKPAKKPETSEEAATVLKSKIERQQAAQAIRLKYVDEFATVLNPDQLMRIYEVEGQIQHKLSNRQHGHGNGRGPGQGQGQGRGPGRGNGQSRGPGRPDFGR